MEIEDDSDRLPQSAFEWTRLTRKLPEIFDKPWPRIVHTGHVFLIASTYKLQLFNKLIVGILCRHFLLLIQFPL